MMVKIMFKKIDIDTWDRKEHYAFFKNLDIPQYEMTFELDITSFYHKIKENKQSFYFQMMHLVMDVINDLEPFKYRMVDDHVYLYDCVHPSFTDRMGDSTLFKIVTTPFIKDSKTFILEAKRRSNAQHSFIDLEQEKRQDLVYITSFPWASYIAASNAINIDSKDAIPRASWGKFFMKENRVFLPFTLRVHHSFVNGYDVGLFIENIQKKLMM